MKPPRDLQAYVPAADAARMLQSLSKDILKSRKRYPLCKVRVEVSNWNEEWRKPK